MRSARLARVLAFATILVAGIGIIAGPAHAQVSRHYDYDAFETTYVVHPDSTVSVTEVITYHFTGAYHYGYRSIPFKGSDAISDIRVYDTQTGEPYQRIAVPPEDKTSPSNHGTYTTYYQNGAESVEWYYDLADTTHSWTVTYTLHGAVGFYKDHDELYENIFTDLNESVGQVRATLVLPGDDTKPQSIWYVKSPNHETAIARPDAHTFVFTASTFAAGEPATIAVGWQKGMVSQSAYWHWYLGREWPNILGMLIAIATLLFIPIHWFITERYRKGRGVIVAQYEPPEHLPPAMAEVLIKEHITWRTWPATVIDLATRGYLKVEQGSWSIMSVIVALFSIAHTVFFTFLIALVFGEVLAVIPDSIGGPLLIIPLALAVYIFIQILSGKSFKDIFALPKSYVLRQNLDQDMSGLRGYEVQFLDALFPTGTTTFSTQDLMWSQSKKRELYEALQNVKRELEDDTVQETKGYTIGFWHLHGNMPAGVPWMLGIVPLFIAVLGVEAVVAPHFLLLTFMVAASAVIITYFVKFDPRLNDAGFVLREDWLGFKLYLETADRYRLQNLTPETFEKYLPYAMIFGVEKKWARAFRSISLESLSWYDGGRVGGVGAIAGGTFSANSFTSSFSASFASSFSSSSGGSGGGFSGGGGSAGGGGGGGGGGAG